MCSQFHSKSFPCVVLQGFTGPAIRQIEYCHHEHQSEPQLALWHTTLWLKKKDITVTGLIAVFLLLLYVWLCCFLFFFHELNHRCYEPAKCCPVMLTCWECKNSTECCSAECQSENLLEQTVFLLFCMSELTLWWVSASESLGIS